MKCDLTNEQSPKIPLDTFVGPSASLWKVDIKMVVCVCVYVLLNTSHTGVCLSCCGF